MPGPGGALDALAAVVLVGAAAALAAVVLVEPGALAAWVLAKPGFCCCFIGGRGPLARTAGRNPAWGPRAEGGPGACASRSWRDFLWRE